MMRAVGGERDCQLCLAAARRPEDLVDVAGLKAGAAHEVVDVETASSPGGRRSTAHRGLGPNFSIRS